MGNPFYTGPLPNRDAATYAGFAVYANGYFEADAKTRAGANRIAAKIRRAGLVPTVTRYATDGVWTWNEATDAP